MASKRGDPLMFAAVVIGAVAAGLFVYTRTRSGPATRINVPRGASIVGGEYISGVVDPYTGKFITGSQMGAIDWGV